MPQFESLVNESEFISDHYLTSDETKQTFLTQVRAQRRQWNTDRKEDLETPISRFTTARLELLVGLSSLTGHLEQASEAETQQQREQGDPTSATTAIYRQLCDVLGYRGDFHSIELARGQDMLGLHGVWSQPRPGTEDPAVVIIPAEAAATLEDALSTAKPWNAVTYGEKPQQDWSISKTVSEVFQVEEPPSYVLILAGRYLILAERARWAEGRYLAMDLLLVAERNETKQGGEIDYFLTTFGSQALLPEADGSIWWDTILEEAVSHAVAVSEDLREGIRRSIELIANDVLDRHRDQGLGLEDVDGNVLARQAMRYLYRILFLLYAEASPELGVLPVGSEEYDTGYGLDRLRELISQELTDVQAERGTHFYESLDLLFRLVNGSHKIYGDGNGTKPAQVDDDGLVFQPLRADLFEPAATSLIDRVKLSNRALYEVLTRLLLSSEEAGVQRGYVSYATLGVNQLGAVYEGLMSYTGFIAEQPLHEVAPGGDSRKGSWVVPIDRSDDISPDDFVTVTDPETGKTKPIVHPKGSFVYRLAGRERQQSASYYTPEVLTRFVVQQALEELLDQPDDEGKPRRTSAEEILELTVCEPALGSGAFAIEAVRQLAEEYLTRREEELNQRIPAEDRPAELQKVKAHIALHQVYGVDLNDTAVELAEISLWLDTMSTDLQAPWFGLRLKQGNSLLGAKRASYTRAQVNRKEYLKVAPTEHPLTSMAEAMTNEQQDDALLGRVHHFLLPAEGWGAAASIKEMKGLARQNQKTLRDWQRQITKPLSSAQLDALLRSAHRVETLWPMALRRLQVAEAEAKRDIKYFGKAPIDNSAVKEAVVSREKIEAKLHDANGVYQRLKLVMDLWSALWFWPVVPDGEAQLVPPSMDEWIDVLDMILGSGQTMEKARNQALGQGDLLGSATWEDLNDAEAIEQAATNMRPISTITDLHPWVQIGQKIAAEQNFFHWELEFGTIFARGGFDLQIGNPPWVRPDVDEEATLAEFDPWWQLAHKPTQAQKQSRREQTLRTPESVRRFAQYIIVNPQIREWLGAKTQFPVVAGLRPDLYRSFMERTWASAQVNGVVGLVHPISHFTEIRAGALRRATYLRLRRHWHFVNSLKLYEIGHRVNYGVHIYGPRRVAPSFLMASSVYHPDTVTASLSHDSSGPVPGLRDDDHQWDTRPHKHRIQLIDVSVLETWKSILEEPHTPVAETRMLFLPNTVNAAVLDKIAAKPRIRELGWQSSAGWNETTDRKKGFFEVGSGRPDGWDSAIIQGPHFGVANPFAKEPRTSMKSKGDYDDIDLEALPTTYIPRTNYQPLTDSRYDSEYTHWEVAGGQASARQFFRICWRRMSGNMGVRTLIPAVIPPGGAHVHTVESVGGNLAPTEIFLYTGLLSSIPYDFVIRAMSKSDIFPNVIGQLPRFDEKLPELRHAIVARSARLICLTAEFSGLWEAVLPGKWTPASPARNDSTRRYLLIELDVLAAMHLNLTLEELIVLYRTQFPVLRQYEMSDLYDLRGRKVPHHIANSYHKQGETLATKERQWTHPQSGMEYIFEFPFRTLDREQDYRDAWAKFEKEFCETDQPHTAVGPR
ncbi:MAG: Eco57I restriction-modification methylase domain-containing protein [Yaniella sp.]|uniref:Eco57I restriction-modification methylase domain-containing protein n=1 Tax=Yaniella sp. TaxID=2773929 RepID=UPI003F9A517E